MILYLINNTIKSCPDERLHTLNTPSIAPGFGTSEP